jgi:hypothetical protein
MPLPIPHLLPGEMFYDYTVSVLWIGTISSGNQQIPLSTLNGITFPDSTVQTTAASGGGSVASVFGRTGAVLAQAADYASFYLSLSKVQTVRSIATSFTQGGVVGPITMTFATPFADNNFTVEVTVLGDEAAPGTPTVTQFPSVGVSYIRLLAPAGTGVNVWVCNNDSIAHTGVVHVTAIHD